MPRPCTNSGTGLLRRAKPGLQDRSSRPHQSPNRTPRPLRRRVLRLRRKRRWGPAHIGFEVGLTSPTVHQILNQAGMGRLDRGDRATNTKVPVPRHQREGPAELIHVDVKKLAAIPDGGGWRTRGRRYTNEGSNSRRVGYRYIHSAVDDRTRIVYSEILDDEKAVSAAGFSRRAALWYGVDRDHLSGSSPTTRRVTDPGCGTGPARQPEPR